MQISFKFKIIFTLFSVAAIIFTSCTEDTEPEEFSIIPEIGFKEYTVYKDANGRDTSISLTITFQDGDGDLGLNQGDTFPPFDRDSKYHSCMYIYYYEFVDSQFVEVRPEVGGVPVGDTIRYPYRFVRLTPNTPNKALKGEITWNYGLITPIKSNRIKFKIYIYDRALHKSNEVESPDFYYYP